MNESAPAAQAAAGDRLSESLPIEDINRLREIFREYRVAIYVPAYNCRSSIASVLRRIPAVANAAVMVLDNCSNDGTAEEVHAEAARGEVKLPVFYVRSRSNLGYAGSQKAAYELLRDITTLEWIVMLHGDGQYEPEMISRLGPMMEGDSEVVYGCRSKSEPGEETPWSTFVIIKLLSFIESLTTGYFRREWHSGFVMYRTRFLRKVELGALTTTPHIDGNLLFVAGLLKAKTSPVTIYKRYKKLTAFEGVERRRYVLNVLKLMWKFRSLRPEDVLRNPAHMKGVDLGPVQAGIVKA